MFCDNLFVCLCVFLVSLFEVIEKKYKHLPINILDSNTPNSVTPKYTSSSNQPVHI